MCSKYSNQDNFLNTFLEKFLVDALYEPEFYYDEVVLFLKENITSTNKQDILDSIDLAAHIYCVKHYYEDEIKELIEDIKSFRDYCIDNNKIDNNKIDKFIFSIVERIIKELSEQIILIDVQEKTEDLKKNQINLDEQQQKLNSLQNKLNEGHESLKKKQIDLNQQILSFGDKSFAKFAIFTAIAFIGTSVLGFTMKVSSDNIYSTLAIIYSVGIILATLVLFLLKSIDRFSKTNKISNFYIGVFYCFCFSLLIISMIFHK